MCVQVPQTCTVYFVTPPGYVALEATPPRRDVTAGVLLLSDEEEQQRACRSLKQQLSASTAASYQAADDGAQHIVPRISQMTCPPEDRPRAETHFYVSKTNP